MRASLALAVAGCGGDDTRAPRSRATNTGSEEAKKGGDLTVIYAGDVDNIDPGITYYQYGFMVAYATQRPLYSFKPDDAIDPEPDLADGPPEISHDGKTLTIKIRKGMKFSPPVNREVTSEDVKYAIERGFLDDGRTGRTSAPTCATSRASRSTRTARRRRSPASRRRTTRRSSSS